MEGESGTLIVPLKVKIFCNIKMRFMAPPLIPHPIQKGESGLGVSDLQSFEDKTYLLVVEEKLGTEKYGGKYEIS